MKTKDSYVDSVALTAEESRSLKKEIRAIKKEYGPQKLWQNEVFVFLFTALMAAVDGVVLVSLTDSIITQSYYLSLLLTFAIACVLNFSCMPMGYSIEAIIHGRGKGRTKHVIILTGLLVVFLLVYGFVSAARFYNSESLYGDTTTVNTTLNINTLNNNDAEEGFDNAGSYDPNSFEEETENGEVWFTWLLIIEPLGTSVLALLLSMSSSSVLADEIIKKKIQRAKLMKKRQSLINAKETARGFDGSSADNEDQKLFNYTMELLKNRAEKLKKDQLVYLSEALKEPSLLSK